MNTRKQIVSLKKLTIISLALATIIIIFLCAYKLANTKDKKSVRVHPYVNVTKVTTKKDVKTLTAIGIIKASKGIDVSSPTANVIESINFLSGQYIDKGSVLITLKNDELKATVEEDKVKYQLAELNAQRSQRLVGKGFVSHQDADLTAANVKQAKARLEHAEAILANTVIKAPFSGILGISQVSLGQYISAGQVIVSLQDQSQMYVEFSIPEKHSDLIMVDAPIIARSNQSSAHNWQGKTTALGSRLDDNTRSLPVRAELFPPYQSLKPGMFVNVTVLLPEAEDKPAIPQNAIVYNPYGNFVYLYKKGIVIQRYVDIGQKIGKYILIEKGLQDGEVVVAEGQQKLYDGATVRVRG